MNFSFSKKYNLSNCFERYFAWVNAESLLAKNSVIKYKEISKRLLVKLGDIDVRRIDSHVITRLKQELNNDQLSPPRCNHFLVVLKNLLKYLAEEEEIEVFDRTKIKKFKNLPKPITTLDKKELEMLVNSLKENTISRLRLKTAVICLISTGCRVSELLRLNLSDIDFETGKAQVIAKGGKLHTLIINELALKYIKKYLAMRVEYANKK
jgi:integrase/recombinase XerD